MSGAPGKAPQQGQWSLEPVPLTPGAVGRLRLEAPVQDGEQVAATPSTWSPGSLDLEAWQVRCEIDEGRLLAEWILVADLPGRFELVPPPLVIEDAQGTVRHLEASPFEVEVVSASGDPATARFAPLRGPLWPPDSRAQQLSFVVLVVLAICAVAAWWCVRRRGQRPGRAAATGATAGSAALARLDALERQGPYGVRRRAEVVGEVLRDFLEAHFRIPARRRTRQELVARLPESTVLTNRRDDVECVLKRAEVAQFAPDRIVLAVVPDSVLLARRLIEEACSTAGAEERR